MGSSKLTQVFYAAVFLLVVFVVCNSEVKGEPEAKELLHNLPTINRCCPTGQEYSFERDECVKSDFSLVGRSEYLDLPKSLIFDLTSLSKEGVKQTANLSHSETFTLRLETFLPSNASTSCSKGSFTIEIKFPGKTAGAGNDTTSSATDGGAYVQIQTPLALFTNTGLLKDKNEYYAKSEFCISRFDSSSVSVRICNPTCSKTNPCIRKCCDLNQVWSQGRPEGTQPCVSSGKLQWKPFFYENPKMAATEMDLKNIEPHYQIAHPRQWCNRKHFPVLYRPIGSSNKFRLLLTGDVIQSKSRYTWEEKALESQHYCLDGIINPFKYIPNSNFELEKSIYDQKDYSGKDETDSLLFDCSPPSTEFNDDNSQSVLYTTLLIFGAVFLVLTIIVYALLWETKLKNVHGWTLLSYVISLLFMYIFFAMMHVTPLTLYQGYQGYLGSFCVFVAVGLNFSFVCTFCWMTSLNLDLWFTVNGINPSGRNSKGYKRFACFLLFALGVPTAIVSTALALDATYGEDFDTEIIIPEYGRKRCNLDPEYAQLVYAYGPAGILLAINLIVFTITMATMYHKHQQSQSNDTAKVGSATRKRHVQSICYRLKLFAKLLVVMGIPWIFEVISWAAEKGEGRTSWYWLIFDIVNILQAVGIFIIFVCNRDTLYALKEKYPTFRDFANYFSRKSGEDTDFHGRKCSSQTESWADIGLQAGSPANHQEINLKLEK